MKREQYSNLFAAVLCALAFGLLLDSCSHSTSPHAAQNDTIRLVSDPEVIHFHSSDTNGTFSFSENSIRVWLTSGTPFELNEIDRFINLSPGFSAAGGTMIFESFPRNQDSISTPTHYTGIQLVLGLANSNLFRDSSELAEGRLLLSAVDPFGKTKYDTILITATFD